MAVLNLEGIQTRYAEPGDALDRLAAASPERVVGLMQEVYREPIKDDLVARRIEEIQRGGGVAVVSTTPAQAGRLGPLAAEAGAAVLLVQSTVITEQHRSDRGQALSLRELTAETKMPVMAGNCVSYEAALQLLEAGVAALFVGVGPGAACTSRKVLGVGVPQATAIVDVAAARAEFERRTGRRGSTTAPRISSRRSARPWGCAAPGRCARCSRRRSSSRRRSRRRARPSRSRSAWGRGDEPDPGGRWADGAGRYCPGAGGHRGDGDRDPPLGGRPRRRPRLRGAVQPADRAAGEGTARLQPHPAV